MSCCQRLQTFRIHFFIQLHPKERECVWLPELTQKIYIRLVLKISDIFIVAFGVKYIGLRFCRIIIDRRFVRQRCYITDLRLLKVKTIFLV